MLQFALPESLSFGPRWLLPAIESLLLISLIVANPTRLDHESRDVRYVSIGLLAAIFASNGSSLGLLLYELLQPDSAVAGRTLLSSAVVVWSTNVMAFGLGFWEIDRGGPIRRCTTDHDAPDLLFPQMESPAVSRTPWSPRFVDYLYVSLTNSTAFSPTDALPLTHRMKALMTAQSLASIATVVIVGARAVNILR